MPDRFSRVASRKSTVISHQPLVTALASVLIILSSLGLAVSRCHAQQANKSFTVADDVGLTVFGAPNGTFPMAAHFSPDGQYVVVWTERGRLDLNRVEDSLRFYRREDVERFLDHFGESQAPSPIWAVNRSDKKGPIIKRWRWLADSSGVAFLAGCGKRDGET